MNVDRSKTQEQTVVISLRGPSKLKAKYEKLAEVDNTSLNKLATRAMEMAFPELKKLVDDRHERLSQGFRMPAAA